MIYYSESCSSAKQAGWHFAIKSKTKHASASSFNRCVARSLLCCKNNWFGYIVNCCGHKEYTRRTQTNWETYHKASEAPEIHRSVVYFSGRIMIKSCCFDDTIKCLNRLRSLTEENKCEWGGGRSDSHQHRKWTETKLTINSTHCHVLNITPFLTIDTDSNIDCYCIHYPLRLRADCLDENPPQHVEDAWGSHTTNNGDLWWFSHQPKLPSRRPHTRCFSDTFLRLGLAGRPKKTSK